MSSSGPFRRELAGIAYASAVPSTVQRALHLVPKPEPEPALEPVNLRDVMELAVGALAVSRIARLVVDDEISKPIREAVSKTWPGSPLETLIGCRACVSVWGAGLVVANLVPRKVRLLLALSEVAVMVERMIDRPSTREW